MTITEEWVPVRGFELAYEVSTRGRVRSKRRQGTRGGLLCQRVGKRGYATTTLVQAGHQETHEVHRLVAAAFLGERPEGYEVRHLDGNRANPALDNLAYGTRSQNSLDKRVHGTDHNVNKTQCPQGHPYNEGNTRLYLGRRYCRACGSRKNRRKHPDFDPAWRV